MGTPSAGVPSATARVSRDDTRAVRGVRARRRIIRRTLLVFAAVVSAIVVILLFAAVAERFAYSDKVLPNVRVDGMNLTGKTEAQTTRELERVAARLDRQPVEARAASTRLVASPSNINFRVDAAATARALRNAGRTHNPFAAVADTVLRRFRPDRVTLVVHYDHAGLEGLLDGWSHEIDHGLVEGDVRVAGTDVREIAPRAGTGIVRTAARHVLDTGLNRIDRGVITLPTGDVTPQVSAGEVRRAAGVARDILAGPVVITADGATALLSPAQIATTITTTTAHHRLLVAVDPQRLETALGAQLTKLVVAPVDANFQLTATGGVTVVPSRAGKTVDMGAVSRAIAGGNHNIHAPMRVLNTAHDTAWAQKLGIKEQVSSFTTYYPSGQSRVTNIHRAADLINNHVVEPGQVFSLNDAIGPRTQARGFVSAPVFYGEFTEDFGGGVSQLATTFFNAVFFGGYEDIAHKPHTIYISRYPMGRESTINYGTVDVRFRDDSHHAVLIRTSYTASSVTVAFYGDKEGKVVTAEGPHILATRPPTNQYINWPFLPKGQQQEHAHGYTGYDVENFRIIQQPGKATVRQRFFWRYKMIPNQILVGTGAPATTSTTAPSAATTSTTAPRTTTTTGH
jgi:vancomycin resistance protein YoaR